MTKEDKIKEINELLDVKLKALLYELINEATKEGYDRGYKKARDEIAKHPPTPRKH